MMVVLVVDEALERFSPGLSRVFGSVVTSRVRPEWTLVMWSGMKRITSMYTLG